MLVSLTAERRQLHRPPLSGHFPACEVSLTQCVCVCNTKMMFKGGGIECASMKIQRFCVHVGQMVLL